MTNKFSSKEIHFLKADPDQTPVTPPDFFFSDLLVDLPDPLVKFKNRMVEYDIPGDRLVCAVVHFLKQHDEPIEPIYEPFKKAFDALCPPDQGIWEPLNDDAIVMAFWDDKNPQNARSMLESMKDKLSSSLNCDMIMGMAAYPFHDFKQKETLDNAFKAIDHAAFFGPGTLLSFDATSLNISADRRYQLGEYDLATTDYQKGLEINPHDVNLMNSLGVCYGISNELDKAHAQFENALEITPDDVMVIYNIGLIYMIKDRPEKAIEHLKKAHDLDGEVFEVELLLGQLFVKTDDQDQALNHLKAAARLNSASGLTLRLVGEIYLSRDQYEPAAQKFNAAIKLNPSDAVSLSGYAKSLEMQNKNLHIALTFAKNSIDLDPGNPVFEERLESILEKIEAADPSEKPIKTA